MPKSISVGELQKRMDDEEGVTILDVRASQAYGEWSIQGTRVQSLNIPNSQLIEHGVHAFPDIPSTREIVAVCAKGIAARETVALLESDGLRAVYLEGGMEAWGQYYHSVHVVQDPDFSIHQIVRPGKGCLSYMVTSGGEAAVVDVGRHLEPYLELAQRLNVTIRHVFDSHLHADHVSGGSRLAHVVGATYWIAPEEMVDARGEYVELKDAQRVEFGEPTFSMISLRTPGHTLASTSFIINGRYLLSGDTVFVSGLGRPDLKGRAEEMAAMMYDTVLHQFVNLSDDVLVLPAHYSDFREQTSGGYVGATLGDIRRSNPLLRERNRQAFVESLVSKVGATPPNYETITRINRGIQNASDEEQGELEIGPNRCAVKN